MSTASALSSFTNEPLIELRRASARDGLKDALDRLDRELPIKAPVWIGEDLGDADGFESVDPGDPGRVIAIAGSADEAAVDEAAGLARQGWREWGARPAGERAEILLRAAGAMRAAKPRLTALVVRECGKPWHDADAEVCEAIDFIEYYARGAVELEHGPALTQVPGERNEIRYVARGTVAVIAPWNFPVAISTGMVTAALATGNSVIYKPAEQSPGCGFEMVKLLRSAGVPASALAFLPGSDAPGRALVRHPLIHTIAFTGSVAVGLEIARVAAEPALGQHHLKRLVAEMGGKNCLIVDADADLDEVIPAAIDSAFGFAGQKCSAASRLIVVGGIADELLARLSGAVETIRVGQASRFGVDLGPVIDLDSVERHADYLALAEAEATVAARVTDLPDAGWFCPPVLVTDLPEGSRLSEEEIFAPLLTVERVPDLAAAIELVDRSKFALTGGLFSRNPDHIRAVEIASPVGNLYINRGITGAMVGRQPFGGNRLSGTGSKAGGPGYLDHFVEPRVVCENTMRHGLVV